MFIKKRKFINFKSDKNKIFMLLRDKYKEDPVGKYFPDFSILKYVEHISASKPYYSIVWNKTQA